MVIAAHQPNYLPNLAFFNKMWLADLFVIITNLQFEKHEGWQQRHKIPGPNGDIWLTVPVLGSQNQSIKDVKINNQINWQRRHKRTIEMVYAHAQATMLIPQITSLYQKTWDRLVDVNVAAILLIKDLLGIKTAVVVDEQICGVKEMLLSNICKKYGADTYLSGVGVKLYLGDEKVKALEKNGIRHQIVEKNLTALYPYSTIHYLLSHGKDWVLHAI